MANFSVVILAAGKGTRMLSDLPKALQPVCGRTMLEHLLDRAEDLGAAKKIVVGGYQIQKLHEVVGSRARVVDQKKLLGSGHAVLQAEAALKGFKGPVLVLYCDTPLLEKETLEKLFKRYHEKKLSCALLSVELKNPFGYGRVLRSGDGAVEKIVEENDATHGEKKIKEINVGCYVFDKDGLFGALKRVRQNLKKKEYYLTDVIGILASEDRVEAVITEDEEEVLGVNTRLDLAAIEEKAQKRILEHWISHGVRIRDPKTTIIDAGVEIGHDTVLLPHTVIEENTVIGANCVIGPFARLRGASRVGNRCVIGNFVEIVRSQIGDGTQVKHLSYLGDAVVGKSVNIGAGTITANFDGKKKHRTVIKDGAQIGSGTILVAPVTIGRQAKTGAGAVITKGKNVPDRSVFVGIPARNIKK